MQAIDFLDKLLRYDHQDRLTAREAMVNLYGLLTCIYTPVYHIIIYEFTCNAKLLTMVYLSLNTSIHMQLLDFQVVFRNRRPKDVDFLGVFGTILCNLVFLTSLVIPIYAVLPFLSVSLLYLKEK